MTTPPPQFADALRDRYVVERELGRGGMATVFLAHDLRHGRPVALKVLHPELAATLGPERFLREIKLAARLQHPHILSVYDSGEAAGHLWYTMPYVEGESLRDRLTREKQLPLEDAFQIARNVLAALDYAHSHGVIHRDIKPENILLESGEAVVADFGIARAISAAGGDHLTQTGMAVGTPAYMSPEQAAGGSELDGRSDLYSMGCVLYEMLAGEAPFTGPTPQAILAKRFLEPVPHLRTLRESVPEAVEHAVTMALAKVPADRFATASQFAQALALPVMVTPTAVPASPMARPQGPDQGPRLRRQALGLALVLLLATTGGFWAWRWRHGEPRPAGPKMLAVLPFENLGPAEDEYFADGLTEEITSRLAGVHDLGVISRTSSMQYKKTAKSLKQIGRELGAGYLLEGSVRWEKRAQGGSRIRVTPQLIEVSDDRHLWADRYDAELADIFQVQTTIAEKVTSELDVALRAPERVGFAAKPTDNLEAYTYFLRGNQYQEHAGEGDRPAVEMFEKAVALDPHFALAFANLSLAHTVLFTDYLDRTDQRLEKAEEAAETALQLQPDLPAAHLALGQLYSVKLDDEHALQQFAAALEREPNSSFAIDAIGEIQRRRGQWTEALKNIQRASELDPRTVYYDYMATETAWSLRAFDEAVHHCDRAIAIDPDLPLPYAFKAEMYLAQDGNPNRARAVIRDALSKVSLGKLVHQLFGVSLGFEFFPMISDLPPSSLEALSIEAFDGDTVNYVGFKSQLYAARHEAELQRVYADSARRFFEPKVQAQPGDYFLRGSLGFAYALLGRKAEAIRTDEKAVELLPVSKDALYGPRVMAFLAGVYAFLGAPDAAVHLAKYLLSIPSPLSIGLLRVDPEWDPIRSDPHFQRLLRGKP